jgi:hypothetical protein
MTTDIIAALDAMTVASRVRRLPCPSHGGPDVPSSPWWTTRHCGPNMTAIIVGGRVAGHASDAEADALTAELAEGRRYR